MPYSQQQARESRPSVTTRSTPSSTTPAAGQPSLLQPPPTPPLLLTKRLTAFLQSHTSPRACHTILLTTLSGSLLASASATTAASSSSDSTMTSSPTSARTLRARCTAVASLWHMHAPLGPGADGSTPNSCKVTGNGDDGPHVRMTSAALTVRLGSGGLCVVKRLRCGLLLVCLGGGFAVGGTGSEVATPQNEQADLAVTRVAAHMNADADSAFHVASVNRGTGSAAFEPADLRNSRTAHDAQLSVSGKTQERRHRLHADSDGASTPVVARFVVSTEVAATTSTDAARHRNNGQREEELDPDDTNHGTCGNNGTLSTNSVEYWAQRRAEELAVLLDEKLASLNVPAEEFGPGLARGHGDWDTRRERGG